MRIRRRNRTARAESSAASDVAFLLIIYFLVIAGFNTNMGFLMNLPAKNSTRFVLSGDLMRFDMDREGNLSCENISLTLAEAEGEIRAAVRGHPNLALFLSIDPKAPWQEIVLFVELAQKLKVDSFSFKMKEAA